jgi:FkbM family methyltransferase
MIFSRLKKLVKKLPVTFTKNQEYDRITRQIIRNHCSGSRSCVDAGAHEGEIFDQFVKYAPGGIHYAFEPIPFLYKRLLNKYASCNSCHIFPIALSNHKSVVPFNYVVSNPAYSGIFKRKYDRRNEEDMSIQVQTDTLDNIIPHHVPVQFIKIDVEGGEMHVLEGAERILSEHHPLVVFEFGLGGSDIYGTTPEKMFSFFTNHQYHLSLLHDFVAGGNVLSLEEFIEQFQQRKNYYFIAH